MESGELGQSVVAPHRIAAGGPPEFGDAEAVSRRFGDALFSKQTPSNVTYSSDYAAVDLPPFLKQVLIGIVKFAPSGKTN